jgi:hypothetical protein
MGEGERDDSFTVGGLLARTKIPSSIFSLCSVPCKLYNLLLGLVKEESVLEF